MVLLRQKPTSLPPLETSLPFPLNVLLEVDYAPINVEPEGGGGARAANHGSVIVRSVPRVEILIVSDLMSLG